MRFSFVLPALLLIGATGCASLGEPYRPVDTIPAGKALVYIYRPPSLGGAAISYTVHAGQTPVGKLPNGGYRSYLADPGETEFWAKTESRSSVTEVLEAGKTYYLKGTVAVGILAGRPRLTFQTEAIGRTEIASCRVIPDAPSPSAVGSGKH
jgi:hypothetical protein